MRDCLLSCRIGGRLVLETKGGGAATIVRDNLQTLPGSFGLRDFAPVPVHDPPSPWALDYAHDLAHAADEQVSINLLDEVRAQGRLTYPAA